MKLKILNAGNLSFILLCSFLISCGINEDSGNIKISPIQIGKGYLSGAGAEGIPKQNVVISDSMSWNVLINQMDSVNNVSGSFTETEIDFSEYIILASFSEIRNSGGYEIEIKNIEENPETIKADVINTIPNQIVTGNITQPYHIVKIPNSGKQVIFYTY